MDGQGYVPNKTLFMDSQIKISYCSHVSQKTIFNIFSAI